MEDDEYKGYRIPAGTIVFPNIWYATQISDIILQLIVSRSDRMQGDVEERADVHRSR